MAKNAQPAGCRRDAGGPMIGGGHRCDALLDRMLAA